MSRQSSLVKNTGVLAIGFFLPKLISIVTLPLLTGHLTEDDYGLLDVMSTWITFLAPFISLKLDGALFRMLLESRDDDIKKNPISLQLTSKLFEYQDKTILGKLYEFLHKDIWSYHKGLDYSENLALELANNLYSSNEPIEKYMLYFADTDCKNSALEEFAGALSKYDIDNKLIDFALNGGDEYLTFIKGYITALSKNINNLNKIQYILDTCSDINIDFVVNNTIIFDISNIGYERIRKIVSKAQNIQ